MSFLFHKIPASQPHKSRERVNFRTPSTITGAVRVILFHRLEANDFFDLQTHLRQPHRRIWQHYLPVSAKFERAVSNMKLFQFFVKFQFLSSIIEGTWTDSTFQWTQVSSLSSTFLLCKSLFVQVFFKFFRIESSFGKKRRKKNHENRSVTVVSRKLRHSRDTFFFSWHFRSLDGIPLEKLEIKAIASIPKLNYVVFWKFSFCYAEPTLQVNVCRPITDGWFNVEGECSRSSSDYSCFISTGVSSSADLLTNRTLRYSAWLMAVMTCIGNSMVLWGRFKFRDENRSVSIVIRNLAVSDLIMSFYLAIISLQDLRYRGHYHELASHWVQSWGCVLAGILSMVSSEVTILILAFMSVERFLLISNPFGHHRLNTKNVMMILYCIWMVGFSIAILPVILFHSTTMFYGIHNGGTCFPLFMQEKYPSGWMYSAFIFNVLNLMLLTLIISLYTLLLLSVWRTRRATTLDFFDCEFAIRYLFIRQQTSPVSNFHFLFLKILLHRSHGHNLLGANNHSEVSGFYRFWNSGRCLRMVSDFLIATELGRQSTFVHIHNSQVQGTTIHGV